MAVSTKSLENVEKDKDESFWRPGASSQHLRSVRSWLSSILGY